MKAGRTPVLLLLTGVLALTGCEWLTGSGFQVKRQLAALSQRPITGEGTELSATFASETVDVQGDTATVFARAEVNGDYRGAETTCVCIEKLEFTRREGHWVAPRFPLPRLAGVVEALEGRLDALNKRDHAAYMALVAEDYDEDGVDRAQVDARIQALMDRPELPAQTVVHRAIRVDQEKAVVTETWQLTLDVDGTPKTHEGRARYRLEPGPDGWRFVSGLL